MNVAIVHPGLSLNSHSPSSLGAFDKIITINLALYYCPCDYWAFLDWEVWLWTYGWRGSSLQRPEDPPGDKPPTIVTCAMVIDKMAKIQDSAPGEVVNISALENDIPDEVGYDPKLNNATFGGSKSAAWFFAWSLNPKAITTFGDDMSGSAYWREIPEGTGAQPEKPREPLAPQQQAEVDKKFAKRWKEEYAATKRVAAWYESRGCPVTRMTPNGPEKYA